MILVNIVLLHQLNEKWLRRLNDRLPRALLFLSAGGTTFNRLKHEKRSVPHLMNVRDIEPAFG
jgi:hypothetical protein